MNFYRRLLYQHQQVRKDRQWRIESVASARPCVEAGECPNSGGLL